ncbi:hypothetical protein Tco_0872947 [Tanacetum coccineum]
MQKTNRHLSLSFLLHFTLQGSKNKKLRIDFKQKLSKINLKGLQIHSCQDLHLCARSLSAVSALTSEDADSSYKSRVLSGYAGVCEWGETQVNSGGVQGYGGRGIRKGKEGRKGEWKVGKEEGI